MRVERVRYALAVMRHGSLRRAAAELGLSQPALSAQLTSLEEDLDTALFVRGRHGARATPATMSLAPSFEALVAAEDRLVAAAMDISGAYDGHVRIGATSLASERVVAPAIAGVVAHHPALQFSVLEDVASEIARHVADGSFEFGVVTVVDGNRDAELRWIPLRTLRLGAFVPTAHPLSSAPTLTWAQLAEVPLVSVKQGSVLWSALVAHVSDPHVVAQTGSIRSVQVMADHGLGLGIAPEPPSAAHGLPGCRWIALHDDAVLQIQLCQRRDATLSRAGQVVRDAILTTGARQQT